SDCVLEVDVCRRDCQSVLPCITEADALAQQQTGEPHDGEVHQQLQSDPDDIQRLARDLFTLEGEEQYDGEQQPVQGPWSDLWDEFLLVPVSPLALLTDPPRGEPSDQGHSEEDEDI